MGCVYRPNCNHVWSVWYCLFVLGLQAYLLYLGIQRYRIYTDSTPWPPGAYPKHYLLAYIGLHALVIAASPFFIAFALFKTGNLASDNDRLGQRTEKIIEIRGTSCCSRKCKSGWQHGPPAAQTVHLLMAFALLLAQQLMTAKLYETGILKHDDIWSTELDFIYRSGERLANVVPQTNHSYLNPNFYPPQTIKHHELTGQYIGTKLLPILSNQKLFGISLDFFNYFLALCIYAVVYPGVLWRASKWFAMLFSLQLMLHTFAATFAYISFSLLFRLHLTGDRMYPYLPNNLQKAFLLPNQYCVIGCYLLSVFSMFMASIVLYGYGYTRFCISWQAKAQEHQREHESRRQLQGSSEKGILRPAPPQPIRIGCCEGYCPHLAAILLLVMMVVANILVLYDTMLIFLNEWPQPLALTCVIVEVVYLFFWIILWLILTCKRRWNFRISYNIPEVLCLLNTDWAPAGAWSRNKKQNEHPENAMILMTGDDILITDDEVKKSAVIRQAHKYGVGSPKEEVYWLKPSGPGSPTIDHRRHHSETAEKSSPEMNQLLGNYQQEPEYGTNPAYQNYGKYYRNSDGQVVIQKTLEHTVSPTKHQQPPREAYRDPLPPQGSYTRFKDPDQSPFDEEMRAREIATTFGTLPRGDQKQRRRLLQGSDADFQYAQYSSQRIPTKQGSEATSLAYASIHKSRPSPTPSGLQSTRDYIRIPQQPNVENDPNASRGSSYMNLSNGNKGYPQQQQRMQTSWDTGAAMGRVPPQARVVGYSQSSTLSSQQSTPMSTRAYPASQQNTYSAVSGNGHNHEYIQGNQQNYMASVAAGRSRQSPTPQRARLGSSGQMSSGGNEVYGKAPGGKLSSFNDLTHGAASGWIQNDPTATSYITGQPASREATPQSTGSSHIQFQQAHWHGNPIYSQVNGGGDTSENSTLTSHGSYSLTPTPGSPFESASSSSQQNYATLTQSSVKQNGNNGNQVKMGLLKPALTNPDPPGVKPMTLNGHYDRYDSANYSLTSSNESEQQNQANNQFATSIV